MELGQIGRRNFLAKSLGALGGLAVFTGMTRRTEAGWSSCSSYSWSSVGCCGNYYRHHHYNGCGCAAPVRYHGCYEPVRYHGCYEPAPACCAPAPTCAVPPPCGYTAPNGGPAPGEEAPPPPATTYQWRYYQARPSRVYRVSSRALRLLER